ncbi:hypothetical protein AVEN_151487-1 [Araneus ventricosus]|uniref:Uncharacterized protein n=1 Tax=Araneus ventricosus TaxID=182803 RepID=A0A4Y2HY99_ARAVE|nr:hypothetical protein AVEN_151487-1 [Araneus ventricosus]
MAKENLGVRSEGFSAEVHPITDFLCSISGPFRTLQAWSSLFFLTAHKNIETISDPGSSRRTGTPQSCSTKTKRQRILHILETSSQDEISMSVEVQLHREGKRDSAAIAKELCDFSPRRGTTIKKARVSVFQAQSKVVFLNIKC